MWNEPTNKKKWSTINAFHKKTRTLHLFPNSCMYIWCIDKIQSVITFGLHNAWLKKHNYYHILVDTVRFRRCIIYIQLFHFDSRARARIDNVLGIREEIVSDTTKHQPKKTQSKEKNICRRRSKHAIRRKRAFREYVLTVNCIHSEFVYFAFSNQCEKSTTGKKEAMLT